MFCKECGAELPDDSKFCYKCGASIPFISEEPKPKKNEEQKNIGTRKEMSSKSCLAAVLFGIFLGRVGVHNFYLGQIGRGIVKIVLSILGIFFCSYSYLLLINSLIMNSYPSSLLINSYPRGFFVLLVIGILLLGANAIWSFIEWVLIACGKAKDSKGLPVKWHN